MRKQARAKWWACWLGVLIVGLAAGRAQVAQAAGPGRFALVIGISDYPDAPLPNAVNDAGLVADAFRKLHFEVDKIDNPTRDELRQAIDKLSATARGAGKNATIAIFYAGHAMQTGGENYLIPKGANLKGVVASAAALEAVGVRAQWMMQKLGDTGAERLLLMLDACRTSPSGDSQGDGLAKMSKLVDGPDTMILFSAQPGKPAYDGNGSTSFFSRALADALVIPNYSMPQIVAAVSDRVVRETKGAQRPYIEGLFGYTFNVVLDRGSLGGTVNAVAQGDSGSGSISPVDQARMNSPEDGTALLKEALKQRTLAQLEAEAEAGNPEVRYLVGLAYWDGIGGAPKNLKRAMDEMRVAASDGVGRAASALGFFYCCAEGAPKDEVEANAWFKIGARKGWHGAKLNIGLQMINGRGVPVDVDGGTALIREAADGGLASAWASLGDVYAFAKYGKQNRKQAMDYYQKAYDGGDAFAAYSLGGAWEYGTADDKGTKDRAKAVEIFVAGGEQGCDSCWYRAASIYADKAFADYDEEAATLLYKKAADLDYRDAVLEYASRLEKGTGLAAPDPAGAFGAYERGSKAGSREALGRVGRALATGKGVKRDPARAASILRDVLRDDLNPDIAVRTATYDVSYWGFANDLEELIEAKAVPPASPDEAAKLLARYGKGGMKRFTVPIDCGGVKAPFFVYIIDWDRPNDESIEGQVAWLKEQRGCSFPDDVLSSFNKLKKIARENKVSFEELTVYALGAANEPDKKGGGGAKTQTASARPLQAAAPAAGAAATNGEQDIEHLYRPDDRRAPVQKAASTDAARTPSAVRQRITNEVPAPRTTNEVLPSRTTSDVPLPHTTNEVPPPKPL